MSWTALARVVVIICVPIILIATPLYLFVTPAHIHQEYARSGFSPSQRFSRQERIRLSDTIVAYLRGDATLEAMANMRTDAGRIALRPEEVQHLVDVKQVVRGFFVAHAIALLLGGISAVLLWRSAPGLLSMAVGQGLVVTAGLIGLVVVSALLDFGTFFTHFHQIFFTEGSWTFYAEDTLIQLYPLTLWISTVFKFSGVILIEAAALYRVSRWIGARARRKART